MESPRASDAVGRALRNAYTRETALPEDMAKMLCRLNEYDDRH